jgi:hypothetical protein
MLTFITLPENFISTIQANITALFTDLAPYIALIVGVLLGVTVISIIINVLRK